MGTRRTRAYWPTRFMIAFGFIATGIVLLLALALMLQEPPMFGPEPTILGLPSHVAWPALGVAVAVFGFVWMIRIFRGPSNGPPTWRYRDR